MARGQLTDQELWHILQVELPGPAKPWEKESRCGLDQEAVEWVKREVLSGNGDIGGDYNQCILYLARLFRVLNVLAEHGIEPPRRRLNGGGIVYEESYVHELILSCLEACGTSVDKIDDVVWYATHEGLLSEEDFDDWRPGMASGSGWRKYYGLTFKGNKQAEKASLMAPGSEPKTRQDGSARGEKAESEESSQDQAPKGAEGSPPSATENAPEMSAEDWETAGLGLLLLLAQTYYKLLESAVSLATWCTAVDLDLNGSYLWTVKNLRNLLDNHAGLKDFPMAFEPPFDDLYPSSIGDVEWQDMVAPQAEQFLGAVQKYTMDKGFLPPEEGTQAWTFIEMFRPAIDKAIKDGESYHKRMEEYCQTKLKLHPPKGAEQSADKGATAKPEGRVCRPGGTKQPRKETVKRMPIKERVVVLNGQEFLLPEFFSTSEGHLSVTDVRKIAGNKSTQVLITGETGTGKESLAEFIFDVGGVPKDKRQTVSCANLAPAMVDSELFGHVKGTFTGATEDRPGLLKRCEGGAIFLDEIGTFETGLQQKLLRFVESFDHRPVGADFSKQVRVRVIAATNADIHSALVPDLVPRFHCHIGLPPLRERLADLFWFLSQPAFLGSGAVFTGITLRTLCGLFSETYPKNIRDLRNRCQKWETLGGKGGAGREHILDDVAWCADKVASWREFAGFVLAEWEKNEDRLQNWAGNPAIAAVGGLLVGILDGAQTDGKDVAAGVPALEIGSLLRWMEPGSPQFMVGFVHDLLVRVSKDFVRANGHACCDPHEAMPLSEALSALHAMVVVFEHLDWRITKEFVGRGMGDLRLEEKQASPAFVSRVRLAADKLHLWANPAPPRGPTELDRLMDQHSITGEDRVACLLCNKGLSNAEIEKSPGITMDKNTVRDHLAGIRRKDQRLDALLPRKPGGRRRGKRPD